MSALQQLQTLRDRLDDAIALLTPLEPVLRALDGEAASAHATTANGATKPEPPASGSGTVKTRRGRPARAKRHPGLGKGRGYRADLHLPKPEATLEQLESLPDTRFSG
jgi:hypothetical protein